jgi:hypothetical protein
MFVTNRLASAPVYQPQNDGYYDYYNDDSRPETSLENTANDFTGTEAHYKNDQCQPQC